MTRTKNNMGSKNIKVRDSQHIILPHRFQIAARLTINSPYKVAPRKHSNYGPIVTVETATKTITKPAFPLQKVKLLSVGSRL